MLVLGAAGGVGIAAVQIGKVCGAIVIAVARYYLPSKGSTIAFLTLKFDPYKPKIVVS